MHVKLLTSFLILRLIRHLILKIKKRIKNIEKNIDFAHDWFGVKAKEMFPQLH